MYKRANKALKKPNIVLEIYLNHSQIFDNVEFKIIRKLNEL